MLLSIGQFSKMTRLSVKALRLYDEKGLLSPAQVDQSTGYRYYRHDQVSRAEAIRILRSVDMPLSEIGSIVDSGDPVLISRQLRVHRERLTSQLAIQQQMLDYLESIIQRKEIVMSYEISVTEAAAQQVAALKIRTSLSKITSDIPSGFTTLVQGLSAAGVSPSGSPMIVYHDVIDQESDGDIEICVPVNDTVSSDSEDSEVYGRQLEGGKMATTIHKGPYEQISPAYHSLTNWITEQDYEIAGSPREIYLNDPRTVPPGELLTRVEFPICAERG